MVAQTDLSNQQSSTKVNRRQRQVLQAAVEEFCERGFDGATWRSIANRASVSQGLIKFYFDDKQGLWQAALQFAHDELVDGLPESPVQEGQVLSRDRVEQWIRAYVEHSAKKPGYSRMMIRETNAPNPRLSWAVHHVIREAHAEFQANIKAMQKHGYFEGLDPILVHYAFIGAVHLPMLASEEIRSLYGKDVFGVASVEQHGDVMVALFLGPKK